MKENNWAELVRKVYELIKSPCIKELGDRYAIDIFPFGEELVLRIQLRDAHGKLVDVFDIPANSEGFVNPKVVLDFIVLAFEIGLEHETWQAGFRRIRKTRF